MPTRSEMLPLALAVKQGLLQAEQVKACMDLQNSKAEEGIEVRLDDLAVAEGLITPQQLATLLAAVDSVENPPQGITLEDARSIHIYDIQEKIGQGGMATVFRAIHKPTGAPRAVKVLFHEHTTNPTFVKRFLREGKLLKSFDNPNIAQGYEYGQLKARDLYFMGMELLEGVSLQEMLDREGPFSEQKAIYCVTEAARGLAYMQAQGIVHRDIKPDNIMWTRDGRIMLVDLGFAKPIEEDGGAIFEDETCGTVQYISPEQARGRADVDIRADIYSLGATLYHLVIGEPPFRGKDQMEVMTKQVTEGLDPRELKSGKLSMHMHYFIEKM
ncbi:MAG: serine/threonine protein kinase, partial [Planctomycetes bacterium]|nr:serine/threonine protein kinase [Planctomycetota bacterium]